MKWFKHFSNAHENNSLTKVRMKYGADGYAIYWYCLELISSELGADENINFELKHDAEVIGFNLKVDSARVEEIMRYMVSIGLFENLEGTITCLKLAKYLDKKTTRNSTVHKIIDSFNERESCKKVSETNADMSRTKPDKSEKSPLDIDTDTDIKPIDTNVSMVISEKSTNDDEHSESNSGSLKIESDIPVCPHKEIIDCYKTVLPEAIHPRTWDGTRMAALKSRWRESKNRQNLDWWRRFFEYIRQSDFLMGRALALNRQPFEIRLDWIVKKENFNKIIDGVYENRQRTA